MTVAVPVAVKQGAQSGFAPMDLGGARSFFGCCHNCWQFGHKAAQCSKRATTALTNGHSNSQGNQLANFINLQAFVS